MVQAILTAPFIELKNLKHIFIELTANNCNLKCKNCYLEFDKYKKIKDFLSPDKIKKMLYDTRNTPIECFYLTGGEPMLHPHFNTVLRMCLKRANTTICTNGMTINDKKARFLRKVEDETNNELIIKLSLDHWEEHKNDELRGRGNFRKVIFAIQSLIKYEFNPILNIVNYYNLPEQEIIENFKNLFKTFNIELDDINFSIIPFIEKRSDLEISIDKINSAQPDCSCSRTLTNNGIFCCPILTQDERGKCGSDFENYSQKIYLETSCCEYCIQHQKRMFVNSWF